MASGAAGAIRAEEIPPANRGGRDGGLVATQIIKHGGTVDRSAERAQEECRVMCIISKLDLPRFGGRVRG